MSVKFLALISVNVVLRVSVILLYSNKYIFDQGSIKINLINDTKITMKSEDKDNHCIIDVLDSNGKLLSRFGYYGTHWAVDGKPILIQE